MIPEDEAGTGLVPVQTAPKAKPAKPPEALVLYEAEDGPVAVTECSLREALAQPGNRVAVLADPLFSDAPEHGGEVRRSTYSHWLSARTDVAPSGYVWQRSDGNEVCRGCGHVIDGGRSFMVHPHDRQGAWHHVACFDFQGKGGHYGGTSVAKDDMIKGWRSIGPANVDTKPWQRAVAKARQAPRFRLELAG